jgi:hypothetical protein
MFGSNPIHYGVPLPIFSSIAVAAYVMGMLVIVKDWGDFQDKKITKMELSTGKILEENLVQSNSNPPDTGRRIHHSA